ncbi:MAG TPA: EF-hand domain-containing protein [Vicinamibacterales bacterium]|nr:EF-hand domain-containing protein [Vicinamibacterales bacterium]
MIVTSLTALAVSVRSSLTWGQSSPDTSARAAARKKSATPGTDTVELSKERAETLMKALDTDGDGVVTKEEFTDGALELLKRASVRFHHLPPAAKGQGIEKRDERWTSRLEDVFAHVDRNHDGAIDVTELTSALPKAAQRPAQRQSFSPSETATGSPTPVATTTSVTVVAVAIRRYLTGA